MFKPLTCGSWFHLSFDHLMVYESVDHGRFVLYHYNENFLGELDRKPMLSRARVTACTIALLPPEAVEYM